MTTIRQLCRELRNLHFKDDWKDKHVRQFKARMGDRELHVQLWQYGKHRVSHGEYNMWVEPKSGVIGYNSIGLRETTPPTDFKTLNEMYRAIAFEWMRPSIKI